LAHKRTEGARERVSQRGRERRHRASWHSGTSSGFISAFGSGEQEVSTAGTWEPPHRCFASWRKKKTARFAQRPLALEGFLGF
jgi:hypothetical protein